MNEDAIQKMQILIPKTYVNQAASSRLQQTKLFSELIKKRKCPKKGWKDSSIELLLQELSLMDSNNFAFNVGVGEREARIYSDLVARRHYSFGHGIGRSGDLTEIQPKAAGSSLIYKLTNSMMLDLIKITGIRHCPDCVVVPMATGMSLVLCLMTIRKDRPDAKFVLWPRIDQKSCFKSILAAGYEPIIVENLLVEDELRTNVDNIIDKIVVIGAKNIAAILTTTSCFAPRGADQIGKVASICKKYDIPHIINNAYGLQSSKCVHLIENAIREGRVDAFVQSTDKNFMVPVGGSVIAGSKHFIEKLVRTYPGRASGSPILDIFITLLKMGVEGYQSLLKKRIINKDYLMSELLGVANEFSLQVLKTPNNQISIAMTLPKGINNITHLGSMLFVRGISGTRVLDGSEKKKIDGYEFQGWGTHSNKYPSPYLTAAATIGMEKDDVNNFIKKLTKCLKTLTEEKVVHHIGVAQENALNLIYSHSVDESDDEDNCDARSSLSLNEIDGELARLEEDEKQSSLLGAICTENSTNHKSEDPGL